MNFCKRLRFDTANCLSKSKTNETFASSGRHEDGQQGCGGRFNLPSWEVAAGPASEARLSAQRWRRTSLQGPGKVRNGLPRSGKTRGGPRKNSWCVTVRISCASFPGQTDINGIPWVELPQHSDSMEAADCSESEAAPCKMAQVLLILHDP